MRRARGGAVGAIVQMPFVNAVEVATVFGAFLLFWLTPTVFGLIAGMRQRRVQALASAAAAPAVVEPPALDQTPPPHPEAQTEGAPAEPAPEVVDAQTAVPALTETEVPEEPTYPFQLDDLRRARILEAPGQEALGAPALQQIWEEGLQLAETHAKAIGATTLAASFKPQAKSFNGLRRRADVSEIRFLLFTDLWPTATNQAAAQAVFEIGDGGIISARVVRATAG